MATETVRKILVRVLLDPAFYDLITNFPEEAFEGYDLTEREKRLLAEPDASLYAYLRDAPPKTIENIASAEGLESIPAKEVDLTPDVGDVTIVPEPHQLPDPIFPPELPVDMGPQPQFGPSPLDLHLRDLQDKALEANPEKLAPILDEIKNLTGAQRIDRLKQLINDLPTIGIKDRWYMTKAGDSRRSERRSNRAVDIYVVGTGIVNARHVTKEVEHALKQAREILYIASGFGLTEYFQSVCREARLTNLYETYKPDGPRRDTYETMAAMVIGAALDHTPVALALYGHPLVFCYPPFLVKILAGLFGLRVQVLPGISAMDCVFVDLEIDPATHGLQMYEATDLLVRKRPLLPDVACLLWQIGALETGLYSVRRSRPSRFSNLKQHLLNFYPPEHKLLAVYSSFFPMAPSFVREIELQNMDNDVEGVRGAVTLYIPPREIRGVRDTELMKKVGSLEHLKSITSEPSFE